MSDPFENEQVPRGALIAAGVLVAGTIIGAAFSSFGGHSAVAPPQAERAEQVALRFIDREQGGIAVHDAQTGARIAVLEPGTNGFIRGVLRGLARERRQNEIGEAPAFTLIRRTDGRLALIDGSTGRRIELDAFGHTNAGAFASLMQAARTQTETETAAKSESPK